VLETTDFPAGEALRTAWWDRVIRARSFLGWPPGSESAAGLAGESASSPWRFERARSVTIRQHASGTSLALAAPPDQLFTATEVNEWALCASLFEADPVRWQGLEAALVEAARANAASAAESALPGSTPLAVAFASVLPVLDERAAFARFAALSKLEAAPRLRALVSAAQSRRLMRLLDDDQLTLGSGAGGRTWRLNALPEVSGIAWSSLRNVPCAVVTGSNGKTTTVRLLAACVRAAGWREGYNCSDGVFIAGEQIESGDYSGPLGTRTVLRDSRVEAAILETARGGILRRGLAVQRARVAVITNVSADHFGEYGIHDLEGLADVKMVVASTISDDGLLVLNADDPLLRTRAARLQFPIGWFSRDDASSTLRAHRAGGGWTCGVRNGRLIIAASGEFDLGAIADMPLTVDGNATYNVSNVAGAALAAVALGVTPAIVAQVLARFGANPSDNSGRLMRYHYRGAQVLIDYAHNPDGLSGLLSVAAKLPRTGRFALLLGQAGNRETADIERLAATAASFWPDFVVIKETESYLRGRALGEVPTIIRSALLQAGFPESALTTCSTERASVQRMLDWAQPGDVLVLPVHDRALREDVVALMV
jgi:UDP-N-acetylmuramyl tripeptide synthase